VSPKFLSSYLTSVFYSLPHWEILYPVFFMCVCVCVCVCMCVCGRWGESVLYSILIKNGGLITLVGDISW
jgi:hypothetical protein